MSENLKVELIHLYPLENAQAHHTEKYEIVHNENNPTPVFRRGVKFTLSLTFGGRAYNREEDIVKLIFSFGKFPNVIKGTKAVLPIHPKKPMTNDGKSWYAGIISYGQDNLILEVFSPSDCPVGNWSLKVETSVCKSKTPSSVFDYDNDIYILFNPWVCEDLVCMPDQSLLDEYILTDVGKIWVGPWGSSRGREWVFGQFDACVLPAAMLMFERSNLPAISRGDPIKVTRTISKLVNFNDDDGILIGRWDGNYKDGTAPSAWTGSVPILEEFLETQTPVSYGQCWVFAGVVTTICRALGIPSRVVSNLVSAHDANSSLSVDTYFNANNEEIDDPENLESSDSIWNYHVWNDVWMARPDLPKGYGGWQAIDGTPQETSHGFYQCGPAPVEAIKEGHVGYNYDVGFMVASVNADLMRWKEDSKSLSGFSKIYCNKYHIGRLILTKKPFIFDLNGDKDREDITDQYKQKEGTDAERISLYNAVRNTTRAKRFYALPDPSLEDISFELRDLDKVKIGEDFSLSVAVRNNSNEDRTLNVSLSAGSVFYTGLRAKEVKKIKGTFKMKPKTSETMRMVVTANEYLDKLVEYCIMKIYAITTVVETRQTWADEDDFQILKPNIDIKVDKQIPAKKSSTITLRFVNPLKKTLTECKLNIAGTGLIRNQVLGYQDVRPNALVKQDVQIIPKTVGEQKIIVTFSSRELVDITGSASVDVYEEEA